MKRTKQAAAAVTALALAASMALPVWAEGENVTGKTLIDDTTTDGKATCDVMATYKPTEVIHLDIEWGDMAFIFEPGTWNPEYTDAKDGNREKAVYTGTSSGWNNENANSTITVTNKSNANLKVTFDYTSENTYSKVSGDFYAKDSNGVFNVLVDKDKGIWMQSADANIDGITIDKTGTSQNPGVTKTVVGQATTAEVKLVLTGRPQKRIDSATKIGTVTVTVKSTDYNTVPADDDQTYSKIYMQTTT